MLRLLTSSLFLIFLFFCIANNSVTGQASVQISSLGWKEFTPENESFNILLPGEPKESVNYRPSKYGTVEEHVFSLNIENLELTITSFEYPRVADNPSLIGQILNNARKQILDTNQGRVVKDVAVGLHNKYQGREIIIELPKGQLIRRLYWVKDTLYQLTIFQSGNVSEQIASQFLNSFSLPTHSKKNPSPELSTGSCNDVLSKPASPVIVSEAILRRNRRSISIPSYPPEAKEKRVRGKVKIDIVIDENGRVLSAQVIEGPQELQEVVLKAVQKTTFIPMTQCGKPVSVKGTMTYKFFLFDPLEN